MNGSNSVNTGDTVMVLALCNSHLITFNTLEIYSGKECDGRMDGQTDGWTD